MIAVAVELIDGNIAVGSRINLAVISARHCEFSGGTLRLWISQRFSRFATRRDSFQFRRQAFLPSKSRPHSVYLIRSLKHPSSSVFKSSGEMTITEKIKDAVGLGHDDSKPTGRE
jgi:hypothetical protein